VSSDSDSGSAVSDSKSGTTTPKLHTRNRENSLGTDESDDLAILASKGQLALEIGLHRLSHQTERAWSVVSDGLNSILTSGNHTPAHKPASCPNIDQQKAAMLFAQYEKSRVSRMKTTARGPMMHQWHNEVTHQDSLLNLHNLPFGTNYAPVR
jgi:hypothetical protein